MRINKFFSVFLSLLMLCSIFGGLSVSATSYEGNCAVINGKTAYVDDTVTYDYFIKSNSDWEDFQGCLVYDKEALKLESFEMPDLGEDGNNGIMINTDIDGRVFYSGVNVSTGYKCADKNINFCRATFKVLENVSSKVENKLEIVSGVNGKMIVDDFKVSDDATVTETTKVIPQYTAIEVSRLPKTNYVVGEKFESKNLQVVAVDYNGERNVIEDYTLEGTNNLTLGKNTITVKYKNLKTTFDVNVHEDSGKVYFEAPYTWSGTAYYAHIFEVDTGNAFYKWQEQSEKLDEDSYGNLYYDLNKLYDSTNITDGLKSNVKYYIMFSDNYGNETCALMFNTECSGDTAIASEEKDFENNIDSTKYSYSVFWMRNSKKYGIPLKITSVGTIQGKFIEKGTSPYSIIDEWDEMYPEYPNEDEFSSQSSARTHKERLVEIKREFIKMIDDGQVLYAGGGTYNNIFNQLVVKSLPNKTTYYNNEKFDSTGLEIAVVDDKGYEIVLDEDDYKLSGADSLTPGKNTIVVSYKGLLTTFNVNVLERNIVGIKVSPPFKTLYNEGEELDLIGLEVTAYYDDGSTGLVDNYTVSGYDSSIGKKIIEVNYKDKKAYFTVEVKEKAVKFIVITSYPQKTDYVVGDTLDTTGLEVYAYYEDNTSKLITNYTLDYDFTVSGKQLVTIEYNGFTDTFLVNVEPKVEPTTKPTVKKVTKVSLSKKSVTLLNGRSATVKVKVSPTNATNKKLKWTTSNSKIAIVNSQGKITAKGRGNATIKVMALDGSNKYATVKVTVKQPVTSVKLNRNSAILKVKGNAKQKTVTLKATVNPKNANVKSVKWTTSKSKIATVAQNGKVTAKKKGTCFIYATAKDGSKKYAKCKITVK